MIYFLCFIWATLFSRVADSYYKYKVYFVLLSIVAFIPMLIIGGLRDIEIGTDTMAYPMTTFDFLDKNDSFEELILVSGEVEPLYLALGYLSLKILPHDIHSILFVSILLTILLFYAGMVRMRKYAPIWLSVFLFSFLFYNISLNMQRQILSMAIVFYGFSFLVRKKVGIFILSVIIAFFMHKSAIAGFLCIPIFYIKNDLYNKFLIFGTFVLLFFYMYIISYIASLGWALKYEVYKDGFEGFFSISEFVLRLFFLYLILKYAKSKKNDDFTKSLKTVFICEFIINLLQIKSRFMGRFGYYLYDLYLIFIPYVLYKVNKHNRTILLRQTMILIVLYWWYVYIFTLAGETYPYSSKILGL